MKKTTYVLLSFSILANAIFFSLGTECLLNLLGCAMTVSLDSSPHYPRFIPFCAILGIVALFGLIATLLINIKNSENLGYTKAIWVIQYVLAFILSIPLIKPWEMLFDFLQKTF